MCGIPTSSSEIVSLVNTWMYVPVLFSRSLFDPRHWWESELPRSPALLMDVTRSGHRHRDFVFIREVVSLLSATV